jgi:hypothetical protein
MGLIGNGYRHNLTGRLFGATALDGGNPSTLRSRTMPAYKRNIFVGEGINSRLASLPSASKHPYSWVMANTAGAIKSFMRSRVEIAASAAGELGKPATASGSITITGTVAAGVLLELGLCQTLPEAEAMAKSIRPVINIKPDQRLSLMCLCVGEGTSTRSH